MEYASEVPHDKDENGNKNEYGNSSLSTGNVKDKDMPVPVPVPVPKSSPSSSKVNFINWKAGESINQGQTVSGMDSCGEVNMEASISPDDVVRVGGFGARDGINSFLPVASDSTDFEAALRYARDYEEEKPQEEVRRPGLGWSK